MKITKYVELTSEQKKDVERRYVHWHYDTTSKTFDEWAMKHAFYITKDGSISERHRHCEPSFMAD